TLVLPVAVDPEAGVAAACETVRERFLAAAERALPPFDRVVDALGPARSGARSPLVRLWFNDLTRAACPDRIGAAGVVEYDLPPWWALFDVGLYLRNGPEGYRLHLVTRTGLMPEAEAAALLRQIVDLVGSATAGGRVPVGEVLADDADRAATPERVAATTAALVATHARARPTAPAIADADGTLSYAELDLSIDRAAAALAAAAVPGAVVVVPARRDRDFIVELLACGRAGMTAALVDVSWPARRRLAATRSASATHEFAAPEQVRRLPFDSGARPDPVPSHASHVLFTSGTTGDPLAVRVGHGVAEAALDDLISAFGCTAADRVSLLSGVAHDPVLRDIGLALRVGGTVCVPPPDAVGNPRRIAGWLRAVEATVVNATPALLGLAFGLDPVPLPAVRLVVSGGAPLTRTTAQLVRAAAPFATLVNGYGTTETPQLVTAEPLGPDEPLPDTVQLPVGAPLAGRRVEVRDPRGRQRGVGQLGSVWVAEPYIADGYSDGKDHDRFTAGDDGVRWCRTGDLAHRDTNGRLWLAGRNDRQALVNGYRFTLDEVENTTRAVRGVADALCELVAGPDGDGLRLWVVPAAGTGVTEHEVRGRLTAVLPAPIAAARIILTDLPRLSANLKLQPGSPAATEPAPTAPAALEADILAVVEAVAGHPVDPTGNFFDVGFTSITLLQLSAELSTSLGRPVPVLDLFRHATVRAFASKGSPGRAGADGERPMPAATAGPTRGATDTARRLARMRAARLRATGRFGADQPTGPVRPASD
ncbi:MAG TPA: AMP-binding protein, partial [Micromonosporaceae bacterium]|nr:AMP-binding protein [Micromonosporaceae bacterium]